MSGTLLIDLHASLLRICADLAVEVKALTGKDTGALYFDAYADEDSLPPGDQIGLSGLSFELEDAHLVSGTFMLVYATQTDANLFRLIKGMNLLVSRVVPGMRLKVIDATTGQKKGFLAIADGTRLLPVSGKASRPIQLLAVSFITTVDYQPED